MSSKALEVNIAKSRVDVTIAAKYHVIQDMMSSYYGLHERLDTFLKELSHPYKNWQFILNEALTFSLGYFYDLKKYPNGPEVAKLYMEVYLDAIETTDEPELKTESFKNLYLFWQKIINEGETEMDRFMPAIAYGLNRLNKIPEEDFLYVAKSYYKLNRLARSFLNNAPQGTNFQVMNDLLIHYYEYTYAYWLSENDPQEWLERESGHILSKEVSNLFERISFSRIQSYKAQLHENMLKKDDDPAVTLERLLEFPGYGDFVDIYRTVPDKMFDEITDEKLKHHDTLIFLFHSMNLSGLSNIHEDTLREINRIITWLISNEDVERVQQLIQRTFNILGKSVDQFPDTVLRCVLNVGKGIYHTDDADLVNFFIRSVVRLGFQTPDFRGLSHEWQIQSNTSHIQNIRTWMELIKLNPAWSKKLLSSLVIHLSLSGVLIKDTDLFPKDITGFLNGHIQPVYNLVKQLMRLFPAYFNEIGAEGKLRDISTRIDEACHRKDILIHFLRKQSHVESSSQIISLIEAILDFWRTKSKEKLEFFLPQDIYEQIEVEGEYVDGVNRAVDHIFKTRGLRKTGDLLYLEEDTLNAFEGKIPGADNLDIERVKLAVSLYKLLNQKYCIDFCEIDDYLAQIQSSAPRGLDTLRKTLEETDTLKKLSGLLAYLMQLQSVILSPEAYEIHENIFRKRHIAAGIPSMYGSYHEAKFNALGLTFRLESVVNTLFEDLIGKFDLNFITHATFYRISEHLKLFCTALNIDGISTRELEQQIELLDKSLKIKLVTFTQYLDIFRGFTRVVGNIVSDYFNNIHRENLREMSHFLSVDTLLPKYLHGSTDRQELFHRVSEIFLRDTIASSLALQSLDLFLTRILNTLYKQAERLPVDRHYLMLTYNPEGIITSIKRNNSRITDIVHLGNKGLNIVKMKDLGLPIPPGFIITTEVSRCRELIDTYPPAKKHFSRLIDGEISGLEKLTGKSYGDPHNPLLVSVRSGGVISMPGMMDSYLNVGMNESIANGLAGLTGNEWFAYDCYRRFLQSYGMSFGLVRDDFDAIINEFKNRYSVSLKRKFTPEQMKEVTFSYKEYIQSNGIEIEESPRAQLHIAIQRVLNSWNAPKARDYRKIIVISDDWGTSVTVQTMVFGNISQQAGSGVLFTHSPKFSADMIRLWGDYTTGNQGEDVVAGLVNTYPISVHQAKIENRPVEFALESRFRHIYERLSDYAKILIYKNNWGPQDIEFTFEGPQTEDLYILQTRDMEIREKKSYPSFGSTSGMSEKFLGHGIGVSGGAMSGRVVFTLEEISHWRNAEHDTHLILVRGDTVPEDIKEVSAADGLLTARGGATSHAAIVANRLDKTCVVGCTDLVCIEKERKLFLNHKVIYSGDFISIDGSEGSIYAGKMKIRENG